MPPIKPSRLLSIVLFVFAACSAVAGVQPLQLHALFTDHMVVQRDKPAVIRGFAPAGSKVDVTFSDQTKHAVAQDDGLWRVTLDAMPASRTPQTLTVAAGGDKVAIKDVLVGDVILHARQTSVDISLGRDESGQQAASTDKMSLLLRAISIEMIPSAEPLDDLGKGATSGWNVVDRASALKMTASAYYLGRDLTASVDVPIGIIDLNMGYAFANSWLSRDALMETGKFFNDVDTNMPDTHVASKAEEYEKRLQAELKSETVGKEKTPPKDVIHHPLFPYAGYRGTLLPLAGTALKAVVLQLGNDYPYIFYQKLLESDDPFDQAALNEAYAVTYDLRKWGYRMEPATVPRIAREWRKLLGQDLPIGLIAPPGSDLNTLGQHHREIRELQRLAA